MPSLPRSLTLRDGDIVLRDGPDRDAPALKPVCGERDVCQFTSIPSRYTAAEARAWIERQRQRRAAGAALALAITRQDNECPAGSVNLVRFSSDGREAALGYWLSPSARGRGLAVRAARTLCAWGFQELDLQRIELAILPGNSASHAVLRRLGAEHDGLRVGSHEADGRTWDMVIYSLTP